MSLWPKDYNIENLKLLNKLTLKHQETCFEHRMRSCMKWRFKKEDATHLKFDQHVIWQLGCDKTHLTDKAATIATMHEWWCMWNHVETCVKAAAKEKHPLGVLGSDGGFLHWGTFSGHDMGKVSRLNRLVVQEPTLPTILNPLPMSIDALELDQFTTTFSLLPLFTLWS